MCQLSGWQCRGKRRQELDQAICLSSMRLKKKNHNPTRRAEKRRSSLLTKGLDSHSTAQHKVLMTAVRALLPACNLQTYKQHVKAHKPGMSRVAYIRRKQNQKNDGDGKNGTNSNAGARRSMPAGLFPASAQRRAIPHMAARRCLCSSAKPCGEGFRNHPKRLLKKKQVSAAKAWTIQSHGISLVWRCHSNRLMRQLLPSSGLLQCVCT